MVDARETRIQEILKIRKEINDTYRLMKRFMKHFFKRDIHDDFNTFSDSKLSLMQLSDSELSKIRNDYMDELHAKFFVKKGTKWVYDADHFSKIILDSVRHHMYLEYHPIHGETNIVATPQIEYYLSLNKIDFINELNKFLRENLNQDIEFVETNVDNRLCKKVKLDCLKYQKGYLDILYQYADEFLTAHYKDIWDKNNALFTWKTFDDVENISKLTEEEFNEIKEVMNRELEALTKGNYYMRAWTPLARLITTEVRRIFERNHDTERDGITLYQGWDQLIPTLRVQLREFIGPLESKKYST